MSVFGPGAAAESNSLAEAVHSLAIEVASSRTLRGPYRLVCENHSSLSAAQSSALFEEFRAQLAVVPNLLTTASSAPALQLTLQETASRLVVLLRVPGPEGEQVRLVETMRSEIAVDGSVERVPYAVQQLLWKQREPILSAMEHASAPAAAEAPRLLLVLNRDALAVYRETSGGATLQSNSRLPGAAVASRVWGGSIRFAGPGENDFRIDLMGKRCTGTLADEASLKCGPPPGIESEAVDVAALRMEPAALLTAACSQRWWMLSSSNRDRTENDQLVLLDPNRDESVGTPLLQMAGPVLSLRASVDAHSAVATVFNLATGDYELYRITLACSN